MNGWSFQPGARTRSRTARAKRLAALWFVTAAFGCSDDATDESAPDGPDARPLHFLVLAANASDARPTVSDVAAIDPEREDEPPAPPLSSDEELTALTMQTWIFATPDRSARKLGYMRLGARVRRSEELVEGAGCAGAWYGVEPRGYVCVGRSSSRVTEEHEPGRRDASASKTLDEATLDRDHPLARALGQTPDLSKPMPYLYGFVRANAALYLQVPNAREQRKHELGLRQHRKIAAAEGDEWNRLVHGGANAVELDEAGVALTPPEAPYPPPAEDHDYALFGGAPADGTPWFLETNSDAEARTRAIPNVSPYAVPDDAVYAGRVRRHAGLALIGSFFAGDEGDGRRFAITVDGRLVGADKVKPHVASAFHGVVIDGQNIRLPFAFVKSEGVKAREEDEDAAWPAAGDLTRRSVVLLTGKMKRFPKRRYLEMTDGRWVDAAEVAYVDRPLELPRGFDTKNAKWIDVSIWDQTLVAWEGDRPVYAALVSTGVDGYANPLESRATIRGTFRIQSKHVTATMDADDPENRFELRDVPWVQFFEQGYAIHAAYWHDDFGTPRSHGCINLAPIDARWLFLWTDPGIPKGWHGVNANRSREAPSIAATWVHVRKGDDHVDSPHVKRAKALARKRKKAGG